METVRYIFGWPGQPADSTNSVGKDSDNLDQLQNHMKAQQVIIRRAKLPMANYIERFLVHALGFLPLELPAVLIG